MPRTSTLAVSSPSDRPTMQADRYFTAANLLVEDLLAGTRITRAALRDCMASVFGMTDADGAWSMREAYDVLEAAQLLHLRNPRSAFTRATTPGDALACLLDTAALLPTETYRSEKQIALQQFSTPMPLAWLAARAARITSADTVLEPSAGTGLLAAHAAHAGASLLLNEIDELRAGLLGLCLAQHVTRHDAAHIDAVLRGGPAPDVVLINPPFARSLGRSRDRHAAARHLRSALIALRPDGRCVAIMPANFRPDGPHRAAWHSVTEIAGPRAILDFGDGAFAAHGTSVAIRLMVFDKDWSGEPIIQAVEDLASALPLVDALSPRLDPRPARPTPLIPVVRNVPGGSWFRGSTSTLVAPCAPQPPSDGVVAIDYAPRDDVAPVEAPVGLYVPWRLSRIRLANARPHPDALVESIAMASVPPPVPTYRPMLPKRSAAALSEAQLEAIILAGDAFERDLPGRFTPNAAGDLLTEDAAGAAYRTGFFIGDGTGVGKGREVAACIMDQWCRGRKRAVWVSKSATLIEDARRDWSALGGLPIDIVGLDTFPSGQAISMGSGILFLTYATLRSQRHDQMSRLDQILAWLGPDHDGMIVFDEAHAMANAAGTETDFGVARGSEQGLAGVRLQNALPRARILYVSATGATDPSNLCYASRLGLWGPGTSFGDRDAFMEAMTEGGIAAMEIVARDLKAMGLYLARALSFAGVEYDRLEHPLSPEQITLYDTYADAWALIHRNLDDALKAANIIDRMDGSTLNGQALGSALSRFESSKQRFFSQLLVAMKTPSLIHAIETEVAAGHSAVVQLVTTAEAVLDRRLAELSPEDRAALDLELSPHEYMIDYLRNAFPVRQMQIVEDSSGTVRSIHMIDEDRAPVFCPEALDARDRLIEELCALPPIATPLDALIAHFGKDAIAEVTGRSRRIVLNTRGEQHLERRSGSANLAESRAFMDGRKTILAFSDAGGTGRSYHADCDCPSAPRRRIHFLLEPGWRAAAAIQGLGRTHRTNQASAPVFRPVTTDCRGERRFISTIARRLDSLGALTRGQRQTGGQNLFDPADNLESDYATIPDTSGDPFWTKAPRGTLVAVMRKLARDNRMLVSVLLDTLMRSKLKDLATFAIGTDAAAFISVEGERTSAGIQAELASVMRSFSYLDDTRDGFSIRDWVSNERDDSWLFITVQEDQLPSLRPLITVWLDIAISAILSIRPDHRRRLYCIIDELPSLQRLPSLSRFLARARKYGGCGILGFQSYPQLEATYGAKEAAAVTGYCSTWVALRANDTLTAKHVSENLGQVEQVEANEGMSYGVNDMRDGVNLSRIQVTRPLVMPTEVTNLPNMAGFLRFGRNLPVLRFQDRYSPLPTRFPTFVDRTEPVERIEEQIAAAPAAPPTPAPVATHTAPSRARRKRSSANSGGSTTESAPTLPFDAATPPEQATERTASVGPKVILMGRRSAGLQQHDRATGDRNPARPA